MALKYPNPLNLSLKGLKTWQTHDGGGWQFTLYADGKRVAIVTDEGNGGMQGYDALGPEGKRVHADLVALCKTLPKETHYGIEMEVDTEFYFSAMVDEAETEKQLARVRRRATPFRLLTDEANSFRTVTTTDVAKAQAFLAKKYGPGNFVVL